MNQAEIDLIAQSITQTYGTSEQMEERYAALDIEWHCPGRHGVVHCTNEAGLNEAHKTLTYFFGDKCDWRNDGFDIEFVHMTKVFPAPTRPWGWCGTTMLFKAWKQQEESRRSAATAFRIGDHVSFVHKGAVQRGIVSGIGRTSRLAVIVGHQKWYVPAERATKCS